MSSFNQITIIGNLGTDPETRTAGSSQVCSFRVAVSDPFKKDHTDWFSVDAWGKAGEFAAQYIKKGHKVVVTGRIGSREYEGKTYWTINASDVRSLTPRDQDGGQGGGQGGGGNNNRGNQGGGGGGGNWGNNNQGGGNNQGQQGGNQGGGGWGGNSGGGGGGGGNRNQGGGGQGGWGGGGGDDPIPF